MTFYDNSLESKSNLYLKSLQHLVKDRIICEDDPDRKYNKKKRYEKIFEFLYLCPQSSKRMKIRYLNYQIGLDHEEKRFYFSQHNISQRSSPLKERKEKKGNSMQCNSMKIKMKERK